MAESAAAGGLEEIAEEAETPNFAPEYPNGDLSRFMLPEGQDSNVIDEMFNRKLPGEENEITFSKNGLIQLINEKLSAADDDLQLWKSRLVRGDTIRFVAKDPEI